MATCISCTIERENLNGLQCQNERMCLCVVAEEESPIQSRKTSPSTSPSSSLYGGTSRPPSESADGPFKKRSKPAVILRKVKKSLSSTISDVNMREGSSTGRPVAMMKGLISTLTGGMSQGNVTMTTVDITQTMESTTASSNDVTVDECVSGEQNGVTNEATEKPTILSAVANQLSQETLAAR